jgi:hypothetical protein
MLYAHFAPSSVLWSPGSPFPTGSSANSFSSQPAPFREPAASPGPRASPQPPVSPVPLPPPCSLGGPAPTASTPPRSSGPGSIGSPPSPSLSSPCFSQPSGSALRASHESGAPISRHRQNFPRYPRPKLRCRHLLRGLSRRRRRQRAHLRRLCRRRSPLLS